jgi:hypothetical protein
VTSGMRLALDVVLALLAALLAVALAVQVVDRRAGIADIEPGDRVEAAVDALRDSAVHVPPDGRAMLSAEAEERLEAVIAESPVPVHVVVWRSSREAGGEPYSFTLPEMIAAELGEPGVYVVWQGPEDADAEAQPGHRLDYDVPDLEPVGDPETRLTEFVRGLDEESVVEEEPWDYWGGVGGGIAAGLLIGGGIALAAWLLAGIVRAASGRPFLNRPRTRG